MRESPSTVRGDRWSRRLVLGAGLGAGASLLAAPWVARAQALMPVKVTSDWAFAGPSSYLLLGREKGFFREAGVEVTIDRGFGSGRVPGDVAGGAYNIGRGDINPTLKFMAENPTSGLVVIAIVGDSSPMAVTVRADGPLKVPRDLEGRTLAAPVTDAGRQLFPAFAKATGLDPARITWMSVNPELREPMLVQKRADGITGLLTSTALSLKALGMDWPQQRVMLYRDFGLDLYSTCYMTTRAYLQREPAAVKATLAALVRSLVYAHRHPAEAIQALQRADGLTNVAIETERLQLSTDYVTATKAVKENGLSEVDPVRLALGIRTVEEAFGLTPRLKPEDVYTDAFLPPRQERML